jgi:predicted ABC-type ATPase
MYAKCTNFVNADLIAQGLSPLRPEAAALRAGRLVLQEIDRFRKENADFAFETTLSGKAHLKIIEELKTSGYGVQFFYLWLPRVELSLSRVAGRVMADITFPSRTFDEGMRGL